MQNNQYNTPGHPHPLAAIYCQVSDCIRAVADFVDANPGIEPKQLQKFNKQLVSMFESVDSIGEANQRLDYARETLGRELMTSNQPVPVTNAFGQVVNSFNDLLQ